MTLIEYSFDEIIDQKITNRTILQSSKTYISELFMIIFEKCSVIVLVKLLIRDFECGEKIWIYILSQKEEMISYDFLFSYIQK